MTIKTTMLAATAAIAWTALATGATASESWEQIRPALFGDRDIQESSGALLALNVPYRTQHDPRTDISVEVALPDGQEVTSLTLIIDENPVPVSAVFDLEKPMAAFDATVTMRMNGPSIVRAVLEASDGSLHMASAFVKTSGTGACAAAPVTGADEAIARLGEIEFQTRQALLPTEDLEDTTGQATLAVRHPQYSGMQMDQISLLYIPAHYIDTVEVWTDSEKLYTMTGSISLSENPAITFDYPQDSGLLRVKVTDTEDGIYERGFLLGGA